MISFSYLFFILFSIFGICILDYKYKLAFFYNAKRSVITLLTSILMFVVWDIFGISLGIFFKGDSIYLSNIMLAKDFPIEEIFFLFFLSYFTLILYRLAESKPWQRT